MANISQKWLRNEFKILSVFGNEYNRKLRESEIVKITKVPQRTASRKLNNLSKIKILDFIKEGKNKVYFINKNNPLLKNILILIEDYKTIRFLEMNPKLSFLFERINKPCLVFGSYAKEDIADSSDLDILVFYNQEKDKQEIKKALSFSNIDIHLQFTTINKFIDDLRSKNTLALEVTKNHIIINGLDEITKLFLEFYIT